MKRVVVTGIGAVSCFGTGVEKLWNSVKNGECGISEVTRIDVSDLPTKVAAEVKDFEPSEYIDRKELKRMDRFLQFAYVATKFAVEDSKLDFEKEDPTRTGVIIGSGIGGFETLENQIMNCYEKGPRRVSPFFIPMIIPNMASGRIAMEYGVRGVNECVVTACSASNNSIGEAFKTIQRGAADMMITGGAEAAITRSSFAGFCSAKAMSTNEDPKDAMKPFDADRDGFVMGEGSGILILEELEHALARGAKIYGEVIGYGSTCDAYHITAPHPEGLGGIECVKVAIKDAGISPDEIDYVNTHGTSTPIGDIAETKVMKNVFGDYAKDLPVSSTKSMTGHLLGAAGAIEAIITLCAINDSFLPPTINYNNPDPECDLDYVPNVGREKNIDYALSNALGFGGHNAAIVMKKYIGE